MKYDTYIFDLDGTLLDTLEDLKNSCNYALEAFDMPKRTLGEVRKFVGNGVKKLMERAVPGGLSYPEFDEVYQTFLDHYSKHNLDTTKPYPGVIQVMKALKANGKNVAIVSNKFYDATRALCKHFFGDVVEVAIGEKENIRRKPAPDTVNEAFKELGVNKENAVYVGDSEVDVMTARNSGIPCISVLWGFRSKDFLIGHGADAFIEKPEELLDI